MPLDDPCIERLEKIWRSELRKKERSFQTMAARRLLFMNQIYYLRWRRNPDFSHLIEIVTDAPQMHGFFTWIWHGRALKGNETPFCFQPGLPLIQP